MSSTPMALDGTPGGDAHGDFTRGYTSSVQVIAGRESSCLSKVIKKGLQSSQAASSWHNAVLHGPGSPVEFGCDSNQDEQTRSSNRLYLHIHSVAWGGEKIPLIQTNSPDESHLCWIGAQPMPNIWGPSRKLKQLPRHVPYICMWNVFKRLPFGRPTYIVFPFHPTLVQTFINCWAITIGSQPDSPMRIHHLCRIYTLCMAVTSALNCCSCNVTPHSKSTNGSHCWLNQPEFPPAGTRSAPRLTLHPISYCPPPIMPLFLQPTAPSFPRNSMTQACVCVSVRVVPALENVPSLSVPPPQFSLILPSLGALPYSHPDGPFLLSTLLVLWQCLMVVSTISLCHGCSQNCLLTLEDCELVVCRT